MATIEEHIDAAVSKYEWEAPYASENAAASGMNNTTRIINSGDRKYVLRLYNNHGDVDTVKLEHEVLKALSGADLNFRVPDPVANTEGETVTVLPDGKLACLFRYIEGVRPDPYNTAQVQALGAATGSISLALNGIRCAAAPQYSPYYELGSTYEAMDKPAFLALADRDPSFRGQALQFGYLQEQREQALRQCERVAALPRQWIHGDICCGNALRIGDRISGILDFEFVTIDSRAMELAVMLVDLLKKDIASGSRDRLMVAAEAFQNVVKLTSEERKLLPILMKLRLLDITLHFAARYRDG
ncbi:MAG: aminoglycoside phosphotransferase, partial [Paenibacillus sp.]|nr:aminoglycoside phosphotransferase [Paenibacillus sp.]